MLFWAAVLQVPFFRPLNGVYLVDWHFIHAMIGQTAKSSQLTLNQVIKVIITIKLNPLK